MLKDILVKTKTQMHQFTVLLMRILHTIFGSNFYLSIFFSLISFPPRGDTQPPVSPHHPVYWISSQTSELRLRLPLHQEQRAAGLHLRCVTDVGTHFVFFFSDTLVPWKGTHSSSFSKCCWCRPHYRWQLYAKMQNKATKHL